MPSGRSLTAYAVIKASISAKYSLLLLETLGSSQRTFVPAIGRPAYRLASLLRSTFQGIRVLGTRWSPRSYDLRDFLARNQVPYQWIDVELSASDLETTRLLEVLPQIGGWTPPADE